jgi:hypothetical protein
MRFGPDSPAQKLATLAAIQRAVQRAGLVAEEAGPILSKVGEVGGLIEADSKLVSTVARAPAPSLPRVRACARPCRTSRRAAASARANRCSTSRAA